MTDEERKRRRVIANMLLINYRSERQATLVTKEPPRGIPLGAPFEEWQAYNGWVLDWLAYCRRVRDQHG